MKSVLNIVGAGDVDVFVNVRLAARNSADGRSVEVIVPAGGGKEFAFPGDIGSGRVAMAARAEPDGVNSHRLSCHAKLADGWILYDAAVRVEVMHTKFSAVIPSGWGRLVSMIHTDFCYEGNYPGWSANSQFMALQGKEGGVALACRDADMELKFLRMFRQDDRFVMEIVLVPELGAGLWVVDSPCDVLLWTYAGDWDVAARQYRRQQEQVRPELRTPRAIHPLLKGDPYWLTYNCFAYPSHTPQQAVRAVKELAGPVLYHMYNWTPYAFDTKYPELFLSRDGLQSEIDLLTAAGAAVTPYLNSRIWDVSIDSWKTHGQSQAVRNYRGQIEYETYSTSNIPFSVTCPSQEDYWQRLTESCVSAVRRHKFPGVYLDQIGAAFGMRCYDAGHGHRPGGARSWNAGTRGMTAMIRDAVGREIGAAPIITTENASEVTVDLIDGFLYFCGLPHEGTGCPIPLWQTIYGDMAHCFADNFGKDFKDRDGGPSSAVLRRLARQAVMGVAMGWISPAMVIDENAAAGLLMRNARQARTPLLDAMRKRSPVASALRTAGDDGVFMSAWRDGTKTLAIAVNANKFAATITWPDGKKEELPALGAVSRTL